MKPVYYYCFFGTLMLLNAAVVSQYDGRDHNEEDGDDCDDDDEERVYDYTYIQDGCTDVDKMITPGSNKWRKYGFITAASDGCYNPNMICGVQLNVSADHRITLRFQELSSNCNDDKVQIIGETNTRDFCGFYAPTVSLYSSSNWLRIVFYTGSSTSTTPSCLSGFKLYYTAYHTGECSDDEFKCDIDGRCIPDELKCDMYDNCGDWSDEKAGVCGLSTGAIIAISIISALVGLSCIALLIFCIYNRTSRRKATRRQESTRHCAVEPVQEPVGPPSYTEPPPAYTFTNTVYAGVYDEIETDSNAPPSYNSIHLSP